MSNSDLTEGAMVDEILRDDAGKYKGVFMALDGSLLFLRIFYALGGT